MHIHCTVYLYIGLTGPKTRWLKIKRGPTQSTPIHTPFLDKLIKIVNFAYGSVMKI